MSTIKVNSIEPANAGSEDYFLARAWVNFNGSGTVAIRADGNVSSITDNGTGDYTKNLSSSTVDANYCVSGIGSQSASGGGGQSLIVNQSIAPTTGSVRYHWRQGNTSANYDTVYVYSVVTR